MAGINGWKKKPLASNNQLAMQIKFLFSFSLIFFQQLAYTQLKWQNVDSLFQPLPSSVHVYFTNDNLDTGAFRAYYLIADIKDKHLNFTTDTTYKRRLTPTQFYQKNDKPLVVVNGTFFSFETNQNLNVVIKDGKLVSYTAPIKGRGKDSLAFIYSYKGAIGINKRKKADVAWVKTDSSKSYAMAVQVPYIPTGNFFTINKSTGERTTPSNYNTFKKWRMKTAIGGGPVLLQNGELKITNNEEQMFAGKAINDKHPRTAMGYTKDNKLIILVVEGRNPNASGATLQKEAQILKDLGCIEALNLDGGGSSCLLINGKETIKISDKIQRPVPAVFLIHKKY
jgi:exopolysaccharide biosynthesis protein